MIRRRMTVKRVDPWSVLKLGLVVNIAGAAILVVAGVVVWSVVRRLMLVERVCEQAQGLLGFESCAVDGVQIMRSGLMLAGLSVVVATGVMVFLAFLYNLIADLTGGIEVSMLDHSGQVRSAGGVEVSPELRTDHGRGRPHTGPRRAAASTGASSDPHPTMASATARPQTDVPLVDAQPQPDRQPHGPRSAAGTPPEPRGPGILERATAVAGAAGAAMKGAAERSGAAVKETGAKLGEAGRRATTTLADVTESEAAERAERTQAQRESLDQLTVPRQERRSGRSAPGGGSSSSGRSGSGGARSESGDGLPRRADDGRFVASDRSRGSSGSSSSRSGTSSASGAGPSSRGGRSQDLSPQEAAAERQRARARAEASGRSSTRSSGSRSSEDGDDEPELMFGNHPKAGSDDG